MPPFPVPFGPWTPDRDDQGGAGLVVARNAVPAEGRYRPFLSFAAAHVSGGISGTPLAGFATHVAGGNNALFVGTSGGFFRSTDRSFAPVFSGLSASSVEFAQWGDEILAITPEDGLYYGDIGSGTMTKETSAPRARHVSAFGDFVMLGAVDGAESTIRWSGINDRTAWDADPLTQSGAQELPVSYGAVTGIAWGQYPTVFQERAISRVTYIGPPLIFQIDTLPVEKGCIARGSLARVAGSVFFIGQDGPNIWNGQMAQPLGEAAFRRWWRDSVTPEQAATARVAVDWSQSCVVWQWEGGGLVYSWVEKRATEFVPGEDFPVMISAPDSEQSGGAAIHPAWSDGLYSAGAINSDGFFGTFSGTPYEATFETADIAVAADQRAFVSEVWPDTDANDVRLTLGARDQRASNSLTFGTEQAVNVHGFSEFASDARFHRVRLRIPAGESWTHTKGVAVTGRPTGKL